jgi:hypothetical protein
MWKPDPPRVYAGRRRSRPVRSGGVAATRERGTSPERRFAVEPGQTDQALRERFLKVLLEAALPLQQGPDRERTLPALIQAAALLKERFEQELDELRQEEAD